MKLVDFTRSYQFLEPKHSFTPPDILVWWRALLLRTITYLRAWKEIWSDYCVVDKGFVVGMPDITQIFPKGFLYPTADIILGLHVLCLDNKWFSEFSLKEFGVVLSIDFGMLLKVFDRPIYSISGASDMLGMWRRVCKVNYNETFFLEKSISILGPHEVVPEPPSVAGVKALKFMVHLKQIYDEVKKRLAIEPFSSEDVTRYSKFIAKCRSGDGVECDDLVVDFFYHLHLLHTVNFAFDCPGLYHDLNL